MFASTARSITRIRVSPSSRTAGSSRSLHPRLESTPDVLFARAPTLAPGSYKLHWLVGGSPQFDGEIPFTVGSGAKGSVEHLAQDAAGGGDRQQRRHAEPRPSPPPWSRACSSCSPGDEIGLRRRQPRARPPASCRSGTRHQRLDHDDDAGCAPTWPRASRPARRAAPAGRAGRAAAGLRRCRSARARETARRHRPPSAGNSPVQA